MFMPARNRSNKQNNVKSCFLVEKLEENLSAENRFSNTTVKKLQLNPEASYFENLELAKTFVRKTGNSSNIIILLENLPLEYYEKDAQGLFNLKRDNVSLLVAQNYIRGIYFVPSDNINKDFTYQAKLISEKKCIIN